MGIIQRDEFEMGKEVIIQVRKKQVKAQIVKKNQIEKQGVNRVSHRYIPLTEQDEKDMLETIGVNSIQDLYSDVPENILLNRDLNIEEAEPETQLLKRLNRIANKNTTKETHTSFLGAGVYDHYAPAVVDLSLIHI